MKVKKPVGTIDRLAGGIYRVNNDRLILGRSRCIYIHNGGYYLTQIGIYADGVIDCWGLVSFEEFEEKVRKGWILCRLPDGVDVDVHLLGTLKVKDAYNYVLPEELIKEVKDTIADLNDEPTSLSRCRTAYQDYLNNPLPKLKEVLRNAYRSIPVHMRIFVLGDMERQDYPITSII